MGEQVKLQAADGQALSGYVARPEGKAKGAVVVVQEIFGINPYIRSVADKFAAAGFLAIAPALFDRFEPGVELTYEGADMQRAFGFYQQLKPETALLDVAAGFAHVAKEVDGVAVVGFCFGGLMSWLAATRGPGLGMTPKCSVGYYAGGIGSVAAEEPSCPVMLHFGMDDSHIGMDQVDAVRNAHPEVEVFLYQGAQHGFSCDQRGSFNPEAAKLAGERTLAFLNMHLGS